MKKLNLLICLLCSCALVALSVADGNAASRRSRRGLRVARSTFSKVCSSVRTTVGNAFLYKVEISDHINRGDPRASGPTLICNRQCPQFPAPLYYSDGTLAARLGYYGTWRVTGKARAYCAAGGMPKCSNAELQNQARWRGSSGQTRDGYVYLRMGSSGVCYRINPRLGRTGTAL